MLLRILAVCAVTGVCIERGQGSPGEGDEPADLDVLASQPAHGIIAGTRFALGTRSPHISDGELWGNLLTDPVADCTRDQTDGRGERTTIRRGIEHGTWPPGIGSRGSPRSPRSALCVRLVEISFVP